MNPKVILGICKIITITLTKFKDAFSQSLIKSLILLMLKHHPAPTMESFNAVFKALVGKELPSAPPMKASQAAVIALGWSVLIATSSPDVPKNSAEFKKLFESQIGLYSIAVSSGGKKQEDQAAYVLRELFTKFEDAETVYFKKPLEMEPSAGVLLLLMAFIKFAGTTEKDLLTPNKPKLIDHFIKSLITVKVKPNSKHFSLCTQLLKTISKEEFTSLVLPALSRAMLRSPEIILKGVGEIVKELPLELSFCSMELGKTLITNLYSKDDTARIEAVESLKFLAEKCSDASAIEALMNQTFAVLNGSDGKITVAEYRINILQVSFFD